MGRLRRLIFRRRRFARRSESYQPSESLTLPWPPPHPASPPPGAERGVTAAPRVSSPPLGAERPGEVGVGQGSMFPPVGIRLTRGLLPMPLRGAERRSNLPDHGACFATLAMTGRPGGSTRSYPALTQRSFRYRSEVP